MTKHRSTGSHGLICAAIVLVTATLMPACSERPEEIEELCRMAVEDQEDLTGAFRRMHPGSSTIECVSGSPRAKQAIVRVSWTRDGATDGAFERVSVERMFTFTYFGGVWRLGDSADVGTEVVQRTELGLSAHADGPPDWLSTSLELPTANSALSYPASWWFSVGVPGQTLLGDLGSDAQDSVTSLCNRQQDPSSKLDKAGVALVEITLDSVRVSGTPVMGLTDGQLHQDQWVGARVGPVLRALRRMEESNRGLFNWGCDVRSWRWNQQEERLMVAVDARVPASTLGRILFTASIADFEDAWVLVNQPGAPPVSSRVPAQAAPKGRVMLARMSAVGPQWRFFEPTVEDGGDAEPPTEAPAPEPVSGSLGELLTAAGSEMPSAVSLTWHSDATAGELIAATDAVRPTEPVCIALDPLADGAELLTGAAPPTPTGAHAMPAPYGHVFTALPVRVIRPGRPETMRSDPCVAALEPAVPGMVKLPVELDEADQVVADALAQTASRQRGKLGQVSSDKPASFGGVYLRDGRLTPKVQLTDTAIMDRDPVSHLEAEDAMKDKLRDIHGCYLVALIEANVKAGRVGVEVTVGADGKVRRATLMDDAMANDEVRGCVEKHAAGLEFRANPAREELRIRYALKFRSGS